MVAKKSPSTSGFTADTIILGKNGFYIGHFGPQGVKIRKSCKLIFFLEFNYEHDACKKSSLSPTFFSSKSGNDSLGSCHHFRYLFQYENKVKLYKLQC